MCHLNNDRGMELSCKVCMADTDLSVVTNYSLRRLWNWWVRVDDWSPVLCTWGLNNVVEPDQYIPSGPTSIRSQTALRISFRDMPNFDRVFKIPSSKFIWCMQEAWSMEAIFQSQQHPEIFWLCPNFSVLIWQLEVDLPNIDRSTLMMIPTLILIPGN